MCSAVDPTKYIYKCSSCGSISYQPKECCGKPMKRPSR